MNNMTGNIFLKVLNNLEVLNNYAIDFENDIVAFSSDYELKDTEVDGMSHENHVSISNALVIDRITYEELEINILK